MILCDLYFFYSIVESIDMLYDMNGTVKCMKKYRIKKIIEIFLMIVIQFYIN